MSGSASTGGVTRIRPFDDWLAYNEKNGLLLTGKSGEVRALDGKTGLERWHDTSGGIQPLILGDDSFVNQSGHRYDLADGRRLTDEPLFRRGGCNYAVGNSSLLFVRDKSAAYIDVAAREEYSLRNLRSGCSNSFVAAGGLLNVPCYSTGCVCNYPLQTSFSMVHMPEVSAWVGESPLSLKPPEDGEE
jgi:hypothetical protein